MSKRGGVIKVTSHLRDKDVADRQKLIKGWRQEKLANTRVLVAGAGALGNEIVKNLIMLGIGKIYIVDFDTVVEANLNRCIFLRKADAKVNAYKAEALAKRAKEADPYGYIDIVPINKEIGVREDMINYTDDIYRNIDLIFSGVDNIVARVHLNIAAVYHRIPLIDGGMTPEIASVRDVIPPYTSCFGEELNKSAWDIFYQRASCSGKIFIDPFKAPSLATTTSIAAGLMVHEALKIIFGIEDFKKFGKWKTPLGEPLAGKRLILNVSLNKSIVYEIPKRNDCPICGMGVESYAPQVHVREETQ